MKPVLIAGITIVNLALVSYSIAIITQLRTKILSRKILIFLAIGVFLDVSATICMIIGSGNFITIHGLIGYSSLSGMLIDTFFTYRYSINKGLNSTISARFNSGSRLAYFYWIVAYLTGALIVMLK
jgi:hypothetical protein